MVSIHVVNIVMKSLDTEEGVRGVRARR